MPKPPPLPSVVLARVCRISLIDGSSLVLLAGGFGCVSLWMSDGLGAVVGALSVIAGGIELYGRKQLHAGRANGMRWLVRSQILLLTVILGYILYRYNSDDAPRLVVQMELALADVQHAQGLSPTTLAELLGKSQVQLIAWCQALVHTTLWIVGLVSIGFQGGLALFYCRKQPVVIASLGKFR